MSTKLKVKQVKKDQDGNVIEAKDHATKIAVITDEEKTKSEIIKVDEVQIVGMLVNYIDKVFQANFMLGGVDSLAVFHPSPGQFPALLAINYSQDPDWWDANIKGRTIFDFEEVLRWIHNSGAVNVAGDNIWSMPDLESYYEGEVSVLPAPPQIPGPAEFQPGVIPGPPVIPTTTGPLPDAG
jgi:hypothetical protein